VPDKHGIISFVVFTRLFNPKTLVLLVSISLVLTFVLHDVLPHYHHGEKEQHNDNRTLDIKPVMHINDKKLFYMVLLSILLLIFSNLKLLIPQRIKKYIAPRDSYPDPDILKLFNPIFQAFRTGILNPKAW
jgi:hypothetical protein